MDHNKFSQDQNQKLVNTSWSPALDDFNQIGTPFPPSADEVARRAYSTYLNQGSLPGNDVQHWLEAEAELIAEQNHRNLQLS